MEQDTIHVIYHGGCVDGFASLWAATVKYGVDNVIPHFGSYGSPIPDSIPDNSNVIIADFSYPRADIEALNERSASLRIFDHHESAKDALSGLPYAVFDMDRSGAGITWDELLGPIGRDLRELPVSLDGKLAFLQSNPESGRPWLIDYIEDRDLWRFKLNNSAEIGAFTKTLRHKISEFNAVSQLTIEEMVNLGTGALAMRTAFARDASQYSFLCEMGGRTFPLINVSYPMGSEVAEFLMNKWDQDMAGYFFIRDDGSYQYGFRSRNGVEVHKFAELFGGGGHPEASGCRGNESLHRRVEVSDILPALTDGGSLPLTAELRMAL